MEPPKPKRTDDLAEVERALSVLKGRHPEHERVQREDAEARNKRQEQLDAEAEAEARAKTTKRIKVIAIGGVAIVALVAVSGVFRTEVARRGRLEQSTDAFRAVGFTVVETTGRSNPGSLEVKTEPGCHLAVATGDASNLTIARSGGGGGEVKGASPLLLCTCQGETMTITAAPPDPKGGLSLLRADAAVIGGSRAFSFVPFKASTAITDQGCAEQELDAWLDAKRMPKAIPDGKWLTDPARAPLKKAGMAALQRLEGKDPFVAVELPKESCLIAVSEGPVTLSLRRKGGATTRPAPQPTPFTWCAQASETLLLQRASGTAAVDVVAGPAAPLGGSLGLRELAKDSGITLGEIEMPHADRAWDAKLTLLGAAVPEALITTASTPDIDANTEARVVALSFGTPEALTPEPATDVYSYCEPLLSKTNEESICVFSGAQRWRTTRADAEGGLARAKFPFWLTVMEGVSDPVALKATTELLGLARRLRRRGYDATTLEAMTELANGVEVMGRSGEDAVVAVGVSSMPPYILPYTNGAAWQVTGEPPHVPIKTLEKITLTASTKTVPPKEKRRTVVFRHQSSAPK